MRCVTCGVELIAGKKFCHECGTAAGARCDACGATLEAEYRFCPDCGAPIGGDLAAGAPARRRPDAAGRARRRSADGGPHAVAASTPLDGERKQVTVLFCDLVGSTAIAERLDPEEYHDLLEDYIDLAFPEIYRLEGIVNSLAGDGLMALFGAPVAHEDAPQRAVPCRAGHPRRARPARCAGCARARPDAPGADRASTPVRSWSARSATT